MRPRLWDGISTGGISTQKFRKLLEYYHATEVTCPSFFNYCVEHYGYYLDADPDKELNNNMNTFWRHALHGVMGKIRGDAAL